MNVSTIEVGIRELKNNLSRFLDLVKQGDLIVVTDHGRPVAHLISVDKGDDKIGDLVAAGLIQAPKSQVRELPKRRIQSKGSFSELVIEERR
jgi:prevent-host-death family protein